MDVGMVLLLLRDLAHLDREVQSRAEVLERVLALDARMPSRSTTFHSGTSGA
jgi:hypothetical protein